LDGPAEEYIRENALRVEELLRRKLEEERQRKKELYEVLLVAVLLSLFLNIIAGYIVEFIEHLDESGFPPLDVVTSCFFSGSSWKCRFLAIIIVATFAVLCYYYRRVMTKPSLYRSYESFSLHLSSIRDVNILSVLSRVYESGVDIDRGELVERVYEHLRESVGKAFSKVELSGSAILVEAAICVVRADIWPLYYIVMYRDMLLRDVKITFSVHLLPEKLKELEKKKYLSIYLSSIRDYVEIIASITISCVIDALEEILEEKKAKADSLRGHHFL